MTSNARLASLLLLATAALPACGDEGELGTTSGSGGGASSTTGTTSTSGTGGSGGSGGATTSSTSGTGGSGGDGGMGTGGGGGSGGMGAGGSGGMGTGGSGAGGEGTGGSVAGCGDGVIVAPEACDDGDAASNDGCSSLCEVEPGFMCAGQPSVCTATCGDGFAAYVEICDDGNTAAGDGCNPTCGYEATCGNGKVEPGESCDDKNKAPGDGCNAGCALEPGSVCGDAVALNVPSKITVPKSVTLFLPGTTVGAGTSFGAPSCSGGTAGVPRVVHRYTVGKSPATLTIEAQGKGALADTVIWAYRDCQAPAQEIGCNDDAGSGKGSRIDTGVLPAGTTVFIVVAGYGPGDVGPYTLQVTETVTKLVQSSGTCAAPTLVTPALLGSASFAGTTLANGKNNAAGSCTGDLAADAVYQLKLAGTSDVRAAVAAGHDAGLYLTAAPCANGSEIACVDAAAEGATEKLLAKDLPAGDYYLVVDGFSAADVGGYALSVDLISVLADGAACQPADPYARCATGSYCVGAQGNKVCTAPTKALLSADFDAGLAPLAVVDAGGDNVSWGLCDPAAGCLSDNTTGSDSGGGYALVSDAPGLNLDGEALRTPALDATGLTQVWIDFDHAFDHFEASADAGKVEVSTDGAAWTTAASFTSDAVGHVSLDLSQLAAGKGAFYVRFLYDDQTTNAGNPDPYARDWRIDDVRVYGF